ncbi:hypothetical protein L218DRAFT_967074 [Marasmius fiardii PR-910]|nr:hypothetical protein L218DRAFT_967074 [Marasmius fiardii PR-910]
MVLELVTRINGDVGEASGEIHSVGLECRPTRDLGLECPGVLDRLGVSGQIGSGDGGNGGRMGIKRLNSRTLPSLLIKSCGSEIELASVFGHSFWSQLVHSLSVVWCTCSSSVTSYACGRVEQSSFSCSDSSSESGLDALNVGDVAEWYGLQRQPYRKGAHAVGDLDLMW